MKRKQNLYVQKIRIQFIKDFNRNKMYQAELKLANLETFKIKDFNNIDNKVINNIIVKNKFINKLTFFPHPINIYLN